MYDEPIYDARGNKLTCPGCGVPNAYGDYCSGECGDRSIRHQAWVDAERDNELV